MLINKSYYFDEQSKVMKQGFFSVNGKTYFGDLEGVRKGLQKIGTEYYLFDEKTGILLKGIRQIDGKEYFFNEASGKRETGFQTIDGRLY